MPEYHDYISFPIDLGTMSNKLKEGYYTHVICENGNALYISKLAGAHVHRRFEADVRQLLQVQRTRVPILLPWR